MLTIAATGIASWLISLSAMRYSPHSRVQRDLANISIAVNNYQAEFGQEPPVHPSSFFDALRGNNAKRIRFLSDDDAAYKSGVRCDPWGNPYQVFRGTDAWLVRSSGHNAVFDDMVIKETDDVTSYIRISPTAEQVMPPNGP